MKNLIKLAEANMEVVRASVALDNAKSVKYANFDEEYEATKPLDDAHKAAEAEVTKILNAGKADKEAAGKSYDELSAVLRKAGYDGAVLDYIER